MRGRIVPGLIIFLMVILISLTLIRWRQINWVLRRIVKLLMLMNFRVIEGQCLIRLIGVPGWRRPSLIIVWRRNR